MESGTPRPTAGVYLLAATTAALLWANSRWSPSYEAFWHAPLSIGLGRWTVGETVHFWINDGLMVVFFFVVGLEIRREIHDGELADIEASRAAGGRGARRNAGAGRSST